MRKFLHEGFYELCNELHISLCSFVSVLHSCVSHVLHLPVLDKEKEQSVQTIITATNSLLCIHQFFEKDLTVKLSKSFSLLRPLTFCFHIVRKVCSPESQFLKTEQGECEVMG